MHKDFMKLAGIESRYLNHQKIEWAGLAPA